MDYRSDRVLRALIRAYDDFRVLMSIRGGRSGGSGELRGAPEQLRGAPGSSGEFRGAPEQLRGALGGSGEAPGSFRGAPLNRSVPGGFAFETC